MNPPPRPPQKTRVSDNFGVDIEIPQPNKHQISATLQHLQKKLKSLTVNLDIKSEFL
jgi:hypothetical protein